MELHFWGAARTVTGSMHQVIVNGRSYLLDCGMRQGRRRESYEINKEFPFAPASIEAVILSHAHIDHSGNLPTLWKKGFPGPIYTTPATRDLCVHMLADTAFLQQKDAEYLERRNARRRGLGVDDKSDVIPPLYLPEDAQATMQQFRPVALNETKEIGPGLRYTPHNAGHMLGSTHVLVEANEGGSTRRLLFSGDLGRVNLPILKDPASAPEADYLILESTYGDRVHQPVEDVKAKLVDVIHRVTSRGGHIVAPAFAVGRTQQLVLMLHELTRDGLIPTFPIFVDSPLAINATEVFRAHPEDYDAEACDFVDAGKDPFGFGRLKYVRTAEESKTLSGLRVPYLVIAASGMCEGGRVLHHLKNSVEDPRNMVLITGYQAENTLGRKIVQRQPEVNIFGESYRLRAEVEVMNELSGHADQRELIDWVRPITKGLKRVFLVHGELPAQQVLARLLQEELGLTVEIPERGQQFQLD